MCDPDAEPAQYRQRKEQSPSYEYNCPICKAHMQMAGSKSQCKACLCFRRGLQFNSAFLLFFAFFVVVVLTLFA